MKEWRPVVGLETKYEVSSDGEIRTIATGRIRRAYPNNKGYLLLQLPVPGRSKFGTRTVHCVVAEAFLGARPDGAQINHKDGNKLNNKAENLEWVTQSQNMRHAAVLGLRKPGRTGPGANQAGAHNGNAKLSEANVVEIIKLLSDGARLRPVAHQFGVAISTVHAIKSGLLWSHLPR